MESQIWHLPARSVALPAFLSGRKWSPSSYLDDRYFQFLPVCLSLFFFKDFIERGEGKGKERERNINVWLSLMHPLLGTWPTTQACALDWELNWQPFGSRPMLNPLSYTSQGLLVPFKLLPQCWSSDGLSLSKFMCVFFKRNGVGL